MTKSICAILINYNDGDKIENVLNEHVNQENKFDQVIVFDDGLTDNSINVINKFKKKIENFDIIKSSLNHGIFKGLNVAISNVKVTFIYFFILR